MSFKLGSRFYNEYEATSYDGNGNPDDWCAYGETTIKLDKYKYSIVIWCLNSMNDDVTIDGTSIPSVILFSHRFSTAYKIYIIAAECTWETDHLHIKFFTTRGESEYDAYTQFYPNGYGGFALIPTE